MQDKISLIQHFPQQAFLSEIKKAENALEPIVKIIGLFRTKGFIKNVVENLEFSSDINALISYWFKPEHQDTVLKSIQPLLDGIKSRLLEEQLVLTQAKIHSDHFVNLVNKFDILKSSQKELKNIISLFKSELIKDINHDCVYSQAIEFKRTAIIYDAYSKIVISLSDKSSEIFEFDSVLYGRCFHATPKNNIKFGRISRNAYETLCTPVKSVGLLDSGFNESYVECEKCLVKLHSIINHSK